MPRKLEDDFSLMVGWGFTQKYIFCCLQYSMLILSWQTLSMTFLVPEVDHMCILTDKGPAIKQELNYSVICDEFPTKNQTNGSCIQWRYNHDQFHSTLTEKYDLVCDKAWMASFFKSLFMFGALLMSPIAGTITDRFGRRTASLITSVPSIFGNIIILLNRNMFMVMCGQFLNGISGGCALNSIYVLFMELTEGRRRYALGISIDIGFAAGSVLLGLVSWTLRDWFHIQTIGLTLATFPLFLAWFLPESPSWLILNSHSDKAIETIVNIAKRNEKVIPPDLEKQIRELSHLVQKRPQSKRGLMALFSPVSSLMRTILIMYCRFAIGVVYYGIAMNVKFFGESLFTDFLLSCTLAVPSTLVVIFLVRHFSVRNILIGCFSLETIICSAFAVLLGLKLQMSGIHTSLVVLGWLFAAPAMPLAIQLTTELFPTVIRGTVTGIGFFVTRLGCIFAIYCKELGEGSSLYIPILLFGVLSGVAVLALYFLPDHTSKNVIQTVEELQSTEEWPSRMPNI